MKDLFPGRHVEAVHVEQHESTWSSGSRICAKFGVSDSDLRVQPPISQKTSKKQSKKESMQWHLQHKIEYQYNNTCILY